MALNVVVMAAGKGTRMKSARAKVLHRLGGRSLLQHVLDAAAPLGALRTVVVTGHGAEQVEAAAAASGAVFVRQEPQLGTGHAVQQTVPALDDAAGTTLILNGDVPLIRPETAAALAAACGGERLALLTVELADPSGYGRIVRDAAGAVTAIVEHKDASEAQRTIREVYTGMMAAPTALLKRWVMALKDDNAQREYYLTDIVGMAVAEGVAVVAAAASGETEVLGVNSPAQLADLERRLQRQRAEALMAAGVRLADPARFDLRGTLDCGQDVEIDVNCVFEGRVVLGDGVSIGANCVIRDAEIGAGAVLHPFSHVEGAKVGAGALVGPFARLRPGAALGREVHIGNFVEVKNSTLADGAKANHLAYLGDATVGPRVNYGAGSITANYDGANKHRTVIGADVHVGSNCVLVAPVTIGDGATIGAGSTIGKDAPAGQLTVARARQASLPGWQRPKKVPKG
ncbi:MULTISPECIES: bifunctional UDP-N-acetylglucosamine diphosphorylase/glucosamine-1-phosphate N-acetyltransferase GlmU [unclassified Rubrivivax]|uniref:bifunctional UDP-N-acetylglucosamine diphosphorylase/glucosamine-1-phosphate N-acetyltransferase GlmU n=1 Tax=unclassified Rubrivivax TaxID=2649762 RepID=UPI001E5F2C7D|nr:MULTISPECIES: bifunctional UDP-N-acetylglucosamine diphosphorylase/glucosamine-1-phosphate N-acetyltransferase GlmU [unclassified Rubrivivax]MCC9596394.1 bifunctional UDP-N-acetylglucosamine diphosphorylase/glucosamine-1-phosphate N-acetyltransferase GlmU [Rubrivivax sp. JA1055]MCC9647262.1 bifunctional UDP-N-acetylglucosamine diphosphorylase/glucosamine-1-phosphate N-acetyltransferase GlmU [Rubrivivax sp. JA1029]